MFKWFRKESDAKTLEKELASIASKITAYETTLASLRATHRRYKGALTLYLVLLYTVYLAGWFFLVARRKPKDVRWLGETAPTVLGPLLITGLRIILSAFFTRRIASYEALLIEQRTLQHEKIEAFKARTDFYSTKSLIDRYSGDASSSKTSSEPVTPSKGNSSAKKGSNASPAVQAMQNAQAKVLTPRLQGATPASLQGTTPTPVHLSGAKAKQMPGGSTSMQSTPLTLQQQQQQQQHRQQGVAADPRAIPAPHHWYDRILDVVIGEDESAATSRYQLEQRLRSKDEEIHRLQMEMLKMQKALQGAATPEAAETPEEDRSVAAAEEPVSKMSEKEESKSVRSRRSSRRIKAKSEVPDDDEDSEADA